MSRSLPLLQLTVGMATMIDEARKVALKGCVYHHLTIDFAHVEIHLALFLHYPEPFLTRFVINNCQTEDFANLGERTPVAILPARMLCKEYTLQEFLRENLSFPQMLGITELNNSGRTVEQT